MGMGAYLRDDGRHDAGLFQSASEEGCAIENTIWGV